MHVDCFGSVTSAGQASARYPHDGRCETVKNSRSAFLGRERGDLRDLLSLARRPFTSPSLRLRGSFFGRNVSNTTGRGPYGRLHAESREPCDWRSLGCGVAWRGGVVAVSTGRGCSRPGEPMSWTDEVVLRPVLAPGALLRQCFIKCMKSTLLEANSQNE